MYAIEVRNLRKVYAEGTLAVDDVSFKIEQGDFFALLGPNGAGKSTTIGILAGLVNKSSGSVQVFGHDLDREPSQVKAMIGLVPQEFNFGVFEKVLNILVQQAGYYGIPRKEALRRAEVYLRQLELWDKRDEAAGKLSGGMKRRLMIARAMMHEPKLIILDEPTAGVDVEIRRSMWSFIKRMNETGVTIVLTTHYFEEVEELCHNLAILDRGKVLIQESLDTLMRRLPRKDYIIDFQESAGQQKIEGLSLEWNSNQQVVLTLRADQALHEAFSLFNGAGLKIQGVSRRNKELENLFLDLVGKGCENAVL